MTAIDIPAIRITLLDQISRKAQQLASRIANRRSEFSRTTSSLLVRYYASREVRVSNQAVHTLGQSY